MLCVCFALFNAFLVSTFGFMRIKLFFQHHLPNALGFSERFKVQTIFHRRLLACKVCLVFFSFFSFVLFKALLFALYPVTAAEAAIANWNSSASSTFFVVFFDSSSSSQYFLQFLLSTIAKPVYTSKGVLFNLLTKM